MSFRPGARRRRASQRRLGNLRAAITLTFAIAAPFGTRAETISPDALLRAYPDHLAGRDKDALLWRDGTKQALSDGKAEKSFDDKLANASLLDQLSLAYPKGPLARPPGPRDDPGRFRNTEFFDRMYGNCEKGETQRRLVDVSWIDGTKLRVTSVNGVADRLRAVIRDIGRLPQDIKRYAYPSAGAFNCRVVKDTGKRSMHAYGAAIDVNVAQADYWLWRKGAYRNRIPYEIVEIFERQGFIWGGKWGHFDTMHFEYRPEFFDDDARESAGTK